MTVLTFTLFHALSLFFLVEWIRASHGENRAVVYSIVSRLIVMIAFGAVCRAWCERTRIQSLSLGVFLEFLDQVVLKGIWVARDFRLHPELWKDVPVSHVSLGIFMGYVMFAPVVLVVTFLGWELGEKIQGTRT